MVSNSQLMQRFSKWIHHQLATVPKCVYIHSRIVDIENRAHLSTSKSSFWRIIDILNIGTSYYFAFRNVNERGRKVFVQEVVSYAQSTQKSRIENVFIDALKYKEWKFLPFIRVQFCFIKSF